jgi:hypothetical protein
VKSLVLVYDGAFKELVLKAKKVIARDTVKEGVEKSFRISWKGYPGNPKPETHDLSYFDDDMGFDKGDRDAIDRLGVGEEHVTGGPRDSVRIVRTK